MLCMLYALSTKLSTYGQNETKGARILMCSPDFLGLMGLPDFLTNDALMERFARGSSAINPGMLETMLESMFFSQ